MTLPAAVNTLDATRADERQRRSTRWISTARLLMGTIYFINGLNWWIKIISPYPSRSDFVHWFPPPDVVGAMIENGILFHMVKATELLSGLALLSNRFVPLMLVVALPVTLQVFIVDAFWHVHLRGFIMGSGSLLLNVFLLFAYFGHYRGLLAPRGTPSMDPANVPSRTPPGEAFALGARPMMPVLAALACAMGVVMVIWLGVMIVQHVIDPQPLSAIHALKPR